LAGRFYLASFYIGLQTFPARHVMLVLMTKNNTATLYDKRHEPHRTEFLGQNVFKIVLDIRQRF
jgi:hypothetical protein